MPETAVQAVTVLVGFISSVIGVGSVTNVLVDVLKRIRLPFLGPDKKIQVSGLLAEVVVILVGSAVGWAAATWLIPWAQYLDSVGAWPMVGAAIAFARWFYWQRKQAA